MAAAETLRLFFALPLDEALRDRACEVQRTLGQACVRGPRVKWVERANLHLTLKFLGDMPADALESLRRVGEQVAAQGTPFELDLCGAGCFPPRGAPRTLWLGLGEDCPELAALARRLDEALAEAGLSEPEGRPFTAHFTLGRVKDRGSGRELREAVEQLCEEPVGTMRADRFCLLSSDLTPQGPVYTERACFDL